MNSGGVAFYMRLNKDISPLLRMKICKIVSKKISFIYFNMIKQLPTLTEGSVDHVYTFAFLRLLFFRMLVFGSTKPLFLVQCSYIVNGIA